MATPVCTAARKMLCTLAEYRLLTTSQMTTLLRLTGRTARRQILELEGNGLIQASAGFTGAEGTRGRPEKVLALTDIAVDALRADGMLDSKVAREHVTGDAIRCVGHQLLLNAFRIQLHELEWTYPEFEVRFLSPNSPFQVLEEGRQPFVHAEASDPGFIPDGVFSITHRSRRKTLLFFLEVDMGTQTVSGAGGRDGVIRQKVHTYQSFFRVAGYKRYERVFEASLKGFRLLFLTRSSGRLTALCRLVASMPPSDFIWLAEQGSMSRERPAAAIWVRGGRTREQPHSILGSAVPRRDETRLN